MADNGDFYALLDSGKQTLNALDSLDVAGALQPRHWYNVIELKRSAVRSRGNLFYGRFYE